MVRTRHAKPPSGASAGHRGTMFGRSVLAKRSAQRSRRAGPARQPLKDERPWSHRSSPMASPTVAPRHFPPLLLATPLSFTAGAYGLASPATEGGAGSARSSPAS